MAQSKNRPNGMITGISFDVVRLAIPFNQWRERSIKGYGNAIVPQVMFEIFRAIETTESNLFYPGGHNG